MITFIINLGTLFFSRLDFRHLCLKKVRDMNDKEAAYILFKEGVPQQEIARILQRSEQTITRWKKDGAWDQKLPKT